MILSRRLRRLECYLAEIWKIVEPIVVNGPSLGFGAIGRPHMGGNRGYNGGQIKPRGAAYWIAMYRVCVFGVPLSVNVTGAKSLATALLGTTTLN
jgi:hypothetical protein